MTKNNLLFWLERGLLALGIALAAWCAAVLVEARFHNSAPIAPPAGQLTVTQTLVTGLPGDAGTTKAKPAPSAGTVLGRLEAPSVKMSAAVLEGSDDATLNRGAGHIEDTPFPGQAGNVGIAGHRDTVFRPLRNIKVGDPLQLATADSLYRYRISKTLIVGPDDVYVLDATEQPTLTLVTCFPFEYIGHAPKRFIVQALLVGEAKKTARVSQGSHGSRKSDGSVK
jgi:LPXTG-site transpeptidase (sortase) family protein